MKRFLSIFILVSFIVTGQIGICPVFAQDFSVNQLPVPGTMIGESAPFAPLSLKGLVINPNKPLEFQFIVDTGKGPQDTASVKEEANRLVKYFLAGLTIPEGELWVNLSPYEKDRITTASLGQTELGRDLLAQDYILKQLTASLIYPEKDLGKEFWSRVYAKAQAEFGTTNIPVNTFNKVWILPDQAQVYENGPAAYVTKSTLKVMLDEDYLARQKHQVSARNDVSSVGANIVRQIVIPEITKEVNTGKNFAPLRQIYQALILAKWYKETIQNGLLDALYTNKNKIAGVNLNDPSVKEQIYERYLKAYKKGAFNYIKEGSFSGEGAGGVVTPRKYFSGGTNFSYYSLNKTHDEAMLSAAQKLAGTLLAVTLVLTSVGNQASSADAAMLGFKESVASAVSRTLNGVPAAGLSHLKSFVKAATGDEEGDYMAVDWGGTNLRVVLVHLQKWKAPQILDQFSVKATFPLEYVDGRKSKEEVFGFVAQTIARAIEKIDADPELKGKSFGLGFGFSFPTELSAGNSARLQQWMKGWAVPGVSMEELGPKNAPDIVKLAQTAIDANSQLKGRVTVKTIPNDTIAITLASSGIIGVIGGTGFNIAVRDPETGEIINLEFAHFLDIPSSLRTAFDERLFRDAEPKNKAKFEKMVSGKYLIELLRYQLHDAIKDNPGLKALFDLPVVDSLVLSLAADSTVSVETMNAILSEKYGAKVFLTAHEQRILSKPSMDLLLRAGRIMGEAISGVLRAIDPSGNINNPVIGIDGNVINNPIVKEAVREIIVSNSGRQVELRSREDATAIGTAVSAAVTQDAAMLSLPVEVVSITMLIFVLSLAVVNVIRETRKDRMLRTLKNKVIDAGPQKIQAINRVLDSLDEEVPTHLTEGTIEKLKQMKNRIYVGYYPDGMSGVNKQLVQLLRREFQLKIHQEGDDYFLVGTGVLNKYLVSKKSTSKTVERIREYLAKLLEADQDPSEKAKAEKRNKLIRQLFDPSDKTVIEAVDKIVELSKQYPELINEAVVRALSTNLGHENQAVKRAVSGALKKVKVDPVYQDPAMIGQIKSQRAGDKTSLAKYGGIDLNQISIKRTGKTIKMQFDPAQLTELEQEGFEGFTPVIINITPLSSPFPLLGVPKLSN